MSEVKCILCKKTNYQTATERGYVFDAYCIACRGLFNYLTKVKMVAESVVKMAIKNGYADKLRGAK